MLKRANVYERPFRKQLAGTENNGFNNREDSKLILLCQKQSYTGLDWNYTRIINLVSCYVRQINISVNYVGNKVFALMITLALCEELRWHLSNKSLLEDDSWQPQHLVTSDNLQFCCTLDYKLYNFTKKSCLCPKVHSMMFIFLTLKNWKKSAFIPIKFAFVIVIVIIIMLFYFVVYKNWRIQQFRFSKRRWNNTGVIAVTQCL